MKIGHLLVVLAGLPSGLAYLEAELFAASTLGLPLGLLALLALGYDLLGRSLGEALLGRNGDAEADEALHRALVDCSRDERRRARAHAVGRARHGCPLRRRARRPSVRGPMHPAM